VEECNGLPDCMHNHSQKHRPLNPRLERNVRAQKLISDWQIRLSTHVQHPILHARTCGSPTSFETTSSTQEYSDAENIPPAGGPSAASVWIATNAEPKEAGIGEFMSAYTDAHDLFSGCLGLKFEVRKMRAARLNALVLRPPRTRAADQAAPAA
jgi:hypothetical protein